MSNAITVEQHRLGWWGVRLPNGRVVADYYVEADARRHAERLNRNHWQDAAHRLRPEVVK